MRARKKAVETTEPESITGVVDEVVNNAVSGQPDPTEFDPAKLEQQPPVGDPVGEEAATDGEGVPTTTVRVQQGKPLPPLGRGWTQRYEQPVKYARSTFKDAMGDEHIAFRFELPLGQTKPEEAIIAVMRDHKAFKDGQPNGLAPDAKDDPESYPTGLHFDNLPRGGKAWLLPNTVLGRTVADSIDQALDGVAKKTEVGPGGPG